MTAPWPYLLLFCALVGVPAALLWVCDRAAKRVTIDDGSM